MYLNPKICCEMDIPVIYHEQLTFLQAARFFKVSKHPICLCFLTFTSEMSWCYDLSWLYSRDETSTYFY